MFRARFSLAGVLKREVRPLVLYCDLALIEEHLQRLKRMSRARSKSRFRLGIRPF
ncbi:hypothetical protein NXT3_PA00301 (plasmid) [Sinorhizobium fredii]|uniref:Uncharacterized protein n=1 Tax=Rhizobium fredii TaxID=380 RepID=A0A2L0HCV0_RHIFR|nr:hypothetical protein NXT3_PA00301 [Sinorhizobium fredii]